MSNDQRPTTIVLNGWWAKIAQAILIAAILAGASGLLIALRQSWAQEGHTDELSDHEQRIRYMEDRFATVEKGIAILLERTDPRHNGG